MEFKGVKWSKLKKVRLQGFQVTVVNLTTIPKCPSTNIAATSKISGPQKYILYHYLDPLGTTFI